MQKMQVNMQRLEEQEEQLQRQIDQQEGRSSNAVDCNATDTAREEAVQAAKKEAVLELQSMAFAGDADAKQEVAALQQQLNAAHVREGQLRRKLDDNALAESSRMQKAAQTLGKLEERSRNLLNGQLEQNTEGWQTEIALLEQLLYEMANNFEAQLRELGLELERKEAGIDGSNTISVTHIQQKRDEEPEERSLLVLPNPALARVSSTTAAEPKWEPTTPRERQPVDGQQLADATLKLDVGRQQWDEEKELLQHQITELSLQAVSAGAQTDAQAEVTALRRQLVQERGEWDTAARALRKQVYEGGARLAEEGASLEGEARALKHMLDCEGRKRADQQAMMEVQLQSEAAEAAIERSELQTEVATASAALLQLQQESEEEGKLLAEQLAASREAVRDDRERLRVEVEVVQTELATQQQASHDNERELERQLQDVREEEGAQRRRLSDEVQTATDELGRVRVGWRAAKAALEEEVREAGRKGERARAKLEAEVEVVTAQLREGAASKEKQQLVKELVERSEWATKQQEEARVKLDRVTKELVLEQQRWAEERAAAEQKHATVRKEAFAERARLEAECRVVQAQVVDERTQHSKLMEDMEQTFGDSASSSSSSSLHAVVQELQAQRTRQAESKRVLVARMEDARSSAEDERAELEKRVEELQAAGDRQQQQIAEERAELQAAAEDEAAWNCAQCDELRAEVTRLERRAHAEKNQVWREEKQLRRHEQVAAAEAMEERIEELKEERTKLQFDHEEWEEQWQHQQAEETLRSGEREHELHSLQREVRQLLDQNAAEKRRGEEEGACSAATADEERRQIDVLQRQLDGARTGLQEEVGEQQEEAGGQQQEVGERKELQQEQTGGFVLGAGVEETMGSLAALQTDVRDAMAGLREEGEQWARDRAVGTEQQLKVRRRLAETTSRLHDERRTAMATLRQQQAEHARERRQMEQRFVSAVGRAEREEAELVAAVRALEAQTADEEARWEEERGVLANEEESGTAAHEARVQEGEKARVSLEERLVRQRRGWEDESTTLRDRVVLLRERWEEVRVTEEGAILEAKQQLVEAERQAAEETKVLKREAEIERTHGEREEQRLRAELEDAMDKLARQRGELAELRTMVEVDDRGRRGLRAEEQQRLKEQIATVQQERRELEAERTTANGAMVLQMADAAADGFDITLQLEAELTMVKGEMEEAKHLWADTKAILEEQLVAAQGNDKVRQQELIEHVRNLKAARLAMEEKRGLSRHALERRIADVKGGKSTELTLLRQQVAQLRAETEKAVVRAEAAESELTERLHRTEEQRRQAAREGAAVLAKAKARAQAAADEGEARGLELQERSARADKHAKEEEQQRIRGLAALERIEQGRRREMEKKTDMLQQRLAEVTVQLEERRQRWHEEEQVMGQKAMDVAEQVEQQEEELEHELQVLMAQMKGAEEQWEEERTVREKEVGESVAAVDRKRAKAAALAEAVEEERLHQESERIALVGRVDAAEHEAMVMEAEVDSELQEMLEEEEARQAEWTDTQHRLNQQLAEFEERGQQMVARASQQQVVAGRRAEAAAKVRAVEELRLHRELERWGDGGHWTADGGGWADTINVGGTGGDDGDGSAMLVVAGAHSVRTAVQELVSAVQQQEAEAQAAQGVWEGRKARMEAQLVQLERAVEGDERALEARLQELAVELRAKRVRWEGEGEEEEGEEEDDEEEEHVGGEGGGEGMGERAQSPIPQNPTQSSSPTTEHKRNKGNNKASKRYGGAFIASNRFEIKALAKQSRGILPALRQQLDDAEQQATSRRATLTAEAARATKQLADYEVGATNEQQALEGALSMRVKASAEEEEALIKQVALEKQRTQAREAARAEEAAAMERETEALVQETVNANTALVEELEVLRKRFEESEALYVMERKARRSEHDTQARRGEEEERVLRQEQGKLLAQLEAQRTECIHLEAEVLARCRGLDATAVAHRQEVEASVGVLHTQVAESTEKVSSLEAQLARVMEWRSRLDREEVVQSGHRVVGFWEGTSSAAGGIANAHDRSEAGINGIKDAGHRVVADLSTKCEAVLVEVKAWRAEKLLLENQLHSVAREEQELQVQLGEAVQCAEERLEAERQRHQSEKSGTWHSVYSVVYSPLSPTQYSP
jgi:hypothetical protein